MGHLQEPRTLIIRNIDLMARIECVVASHRVMDAQTRRDTSCGEMGDVGAGRERSGDGSLGGEPVGGRLSDGVCVATGEGVESLRGRGTKTRDARSSGTVSRFRGSS